MPNIPDVRSPTTSMRLGCVVAGRLKSSLPIRAANSAASCRDSVPGTSAKTAGSNAAAAISAHATEVAPYFYTWAFGASNYAANSLAQAKAAGVDAVTLAFGTSNGSCTLQGLDVATFLADDPALHFFVL